MDLINLNGLLIIFTKNWLIAIVCFILYREDHKRKRRVRTQIAACFPEVPEMDELLKDIERDLNPEVKA